MTTEEQLAIQEKAKAYDEDKHHKKVLFADLDGTLIDTISFGGLIHEEKDSK